MSRRVEVLTHGDIDGMVSAVLVMLSLPETEPGIKFTSPRSLPGMLRRAGKTQPIPDEVFIIDIPLAAQHWARVLSALQLLRAGGASVHLYDHHLGWDDCPEMAQVCTTYSVDTSRNTAAKLVHEGRCQGITGSNRWLELISKKDASADPWIRERFGLLAALTQPRHYDDGTALRSLARGGKLTDEQKSLSEWYYDAHVPHLETLVSGAGAIAASSGRMIGWLDLRGKPGRLFLAPRVAERLSVELVVTVNDGTVTVGSSSIDTGPDLTPLHGEHEINCVGLRVVGHKSPVRIDPVDGGRVTDEFVAAVRALLVDRL